MVSERLYILGALVALALPAIHLLRRTRSLCRQRHFSSSPERVLILGASSGVGHDIARKYARRGARLCVVARRAEKINALAAECGDNCIGVAADLGVVEDMARVRQTIEKAWGGLDTIHIVAGVSALQPVMALAGSEGKEDATIEGIQNAKDIAGKAVQGNMMGPLVAALTFIPMLTRTSACPAILLVSSMAALVPAPTRALYAATKASSLLLYQALAIEHRDIAFTFILPATIEGDFRASAVDAGPVREDNPNKHGLKINYVAARCINAVDSGVTGNVIMPWFPYAFAHHMYYLWPSIVEKKAAKKYNFST
ncbi:11-beta-hydroxysteroid dehydrogenase-like 3 [Cytospora mali]|uniref:11-beta-hydroxysteroid dehydrogenase-like 3 n=1 Tax=Cytospora mali TaxID=578113 RepID=A0A194VCF2_CYTMA|nr:11-beta-hydroxysteroid dehydrogenase-like 3 [Valsa mali var. pyri (nom. inval.)]